MDLFSQTRKFYDHLMETNPHIAEILKSYSENWQRLYDLFEKLPEEKLDWRVSSENRSLKEQMAHVIGVEKCYLEVVKVGAEGWKHCHMEEERAGLSKDQLLKLFQDSHQELLKVMGSLKGNEQIDWTEGVFMTPAQHLHDLNHHQVFHQGQLVIYVRQLGREFFPSSWSVYGY